MNLIVQELRQSDRGSFGLVREWPNFTPPGTHFYGTKVRHEIARRKKRYPLSDGDTEYTPTLHCSLDLTFFR